MLRLGIGSARFSRRVFFVAGVYGIVVLLPHYFLEARIGEGFPPPITHPEYFYGFTGVALAWQAVFFLIAHDVRRYRLVMLPAILEKLAYGAATVLLYANGRAALAVLAGGIVDLVFAALFALAFWAARGTAE